MLTLLVAIAIGSLAGSPAGACSEPEPDVDVVSLEDLDESRMVAIGRPEVVARTGATWRWHRAGVLAFTEVRLVGEDRRAVAEVVWAMNDGRNEGGECYFGRDVGPVGSRLGFHVLHEDGTVARVLSIGSDPVESIDPADLTARYGEPVTVVPNARLVEASMAPLTAERRFNYLIVRSAVPLSVVALVLFVLVRRRRHSLLAPSRSAAG